MSRQFELVGGPLDGGCHELHAHVDPDMAESFGQDDPNGRDIHWYRLGNDGRAYFQETQKNSTGALLPTLERQLEECTAAQRLEVLKPYCRLCGERQKKCECWDDA